MGRLVYGIIDSNPTDTYWIAKPNFNASSGQSMPGMAIDNLGNVILAGYSGNGIISFKSNNPSSINWQGMPLSSGYTAINRPYLEVHNNNVLFICGYEQNTQGIWIAVNSETGAVMATNSGRRSNSGSIIPGVGFYNNEYYVLTSSGWSVYPSYMLFKYNTSFTTQTGVRFYYTNVTNAYGSSHGNKLIMDSQGRWNTKPTTDSRPQIAQMASNGTNNWFTGFNYGFAGSAACWGMAIDSSDNIYVTGTNRQYTTGSSAQGPFIGSLTSSGARRWTKVYGLSPNSSYMAYGEMTDVTVDSAGNVWCVGYNRADQSGVNPGKYWFAKLNSADGNVINAYSILPTAGGNWNLWNKYPAFAIDAKPNALYIYISDNANYYCLKLNPNAIQTGTYSVGGQQFVIASATLTSYAHEGTTNSPAAFVNVSNQGITTLTPTTNTSSYTLTTTTI